jgi:CheY-like chemotaxis protein
VTAIAAAVRPRVLWIDDDLGALNLFDRVLRREGMVVDCSTCGRDGLDRARLGLYDVIGLDLELPDLDGVVVIRRLRSAGFDMPVCVLTGYFADQLRVDAAWGAGATTCLPKPVRTHDLVEVISSVMAGRGPHAATEPGRFGMALLTALEDGTHDGDPEVGAPSLGSMAGVQWRLVQTAVRLSTTIPLFHACGASFADTLTGGSWDLVRGLVRRRLAAVPRNPADAVAAIGGAIACLEDPRRVARPTEAGLAHHVGVSASQLGRLLQDWSGFDYRTWVRLGCLRHATRRLVAGSEPVKQIAAETGWSSHSRFDREFHDLFGLSPTDVRRHVAKLSSAADARKF